MLLVRGFLSDLPGSRSFVGSRLSSCREISASEIRCWRRMAALFLESTLFRRLAVATFSARARTMAAMRVEVTGGPVEARIVEKLTANLEPRHLAVVNESHKHNVPPGSETHFKVFVVSHKFEGHPPLKKHRMIHEILDEELKSGVHALAIEAKTPGQWDGSLGVEPSPACRGGFGK